MMLKCFFSTDPTYTEQTARFEKIDGMLAIALYIALLAVYYVMGVVKVKTGINLGVWVNLALIAVCVVLTLSRGQKLSSVGITPKNLLRSAVWGAVFGVVLTFALNVIPSVLAGGKPIALGKALYNIFYFFIVIGLSEEIVFRGYIQPRIYGLIKRDVPAILLVALMFYAMHLPYQIVANGYQFNIWNLLIIVALHYVLNFLYRKFNSLAAPTIMHGLLDWGGNFLV